MTLDGDSIVCPVLEVAVSSFLSRVRMFVFISNADAQACVNTNITSWTGDITSPGYGSYRPNLDCYWLIQVAEGNLVEIEFQEFSVRNGRLQSR